MLLTPQFEPFLPLNPQTLCTWGCVNSTTKPLTKKTKLRENFIHHLTKKAYIVREME